MKKCIGLLLLGGMLSAHAQNHRLEKIWETDTIVAVPESVLPDVRNQVLYVSLIDGGPWDADGKGGIAKLNMDGKNYNGSWITGLNAPKGLGRAANKLYVADISDVVVVDIAKGKIDKRIPIEGAQGLNDITVDSKGNVYVSDSKTARIWKLTNDIPTLYMEDMKGVNGLKVIGENLFILSGKSFVKANAKKQITKIADLPEGGDGLEPVGNGDFIATSWLGYVYYVTADGKVETMLDTHLQKKNTADIGYDNDKRIIYVPTFNGKQVVAYKLK
jgi:hypothetical protein